MTDKFTVEQLPIAERRYVAIRDAVRVTGKRLGVNPHDREVAVQCAVNAWRAGASAASAVERGTRYLQAIVHPQTGGAA